MDERRTSLTWINMALVLGFFLAGFFLLVIFSARAYTGITQTQADNNEKRALLQYVYTAVKGYDCAGCVSVSEDGSTIELKEDGTDYALTIYAEGGKLLEEYKKTGREKQPENAQIIGETSVFQASLTEDGLLTVVTEKGTVRLQLRSAKVLEEGDSGS